MANKQRATVAVMSDLIVTLAVLALISCASTRMTSKLNPALVGRAYGTVMAHGNFWSLEHRQLAEGRLCEHLRRVAPLQCFRAVDVLFPGRAYSSEEVVNRLIEQGIDSVLILQATGAGTTSVYIPPTTRTTGTAEIRSTTTAGPGTAQTYGTITGTSTTHTYGGFDATKPWADYEAIFVSIADGDVAWYATAASSGNAFASWDDLIRSATDETIRVLDADDVFSRTIERQYTADLPETSTAFKPGAALPTHWRNLGDDSQWALNYNEDGLSLTQVLPDEAARRGNYAVCEFQGNQDQDPLEGTCRNSYRRWCGARRVRCRVESAARISVLNPHRIEGVSEINPRRIDCGSCTAEDFLPTAWTLVPLE